MLFRSWLYGESMRHADSGGSLCTLTALIIAGRGLHIVHVGDSRAYRWRAGTLEQLTRDHVWPRKDMRRTLKRAIGLDEFLVVDCNEDAWRRGDRYLIVSDGVWDVLGERALREVMAAVPEPQAAADELVQRSVGTQKAFFGRNDATALCVRVD